MSDPGRILLADDEETFLFSTTELLRAEGYECKSVPDAVKAIEELTRANYDLLIADIKMPGNSDLELVQKLPEIASGMPVILVTGYPTVHTAVQSIQLPVVAYLIKPVDFDQLVSMTKTAVEYSRIQRSVQSTRKRLETWQDNMRLIDGAIEGGGRMNRMATPGTVDAFLQVTQENLVQTFGDLVNVARALSTKPDSPVVCHLMDCPRLTIFSNAIEDVVKTLEHTKTSFKSKELGDLRKRLEDLLASERNARPL